MGVWPDAPTIETTGVADFFRNIKEFSDENIEIRDKGIRKVYKEVRQKGRGRFSKKVEDRVRRILNR